MFAEFYGKKVFSKRDHMKLGLSVIFVLLGFLSASHLACGKTEASKAKKLKVCRKLLEDEIRADKTPPKAKAKSEEKSEPEPESKSGSPAAGAKASPAATSLLRLAPVRLQNPETRGKTGVDYDREGLFFKQRADAFHDFLDLDDVTAEKLEKLGYLSGYQKPDTESGIRINDKKLTWKGYNLYTSGHDTTATLMDMDGEILNEWKYDISEDISSKVLKRHGAKMGSKFFRRAHLYENGDVLLLLDHVGLLKLNKKSRKIWFNSEEVHHDFDVTEDGTIYSLGEQELPGKIMDFDKPVRDNTVVVFDSEGKTLRTVSLMKCLINAYDISVAQAILEAEKSVDIFHANSVDVLEQDLTNLHPALKKGNVLVSIRTASIIAIVNMETEKVELMLKGSRGRKWYHQHEAKFLPSGSIIFFDNTGMYKSSRILELKPPDWQVAWFYEGKPPESFHSKLHGAVQRLPNGNTLITESDWGRAFEVTPKGQKVWEFVSPHRAFDDPTLIAVLCDVNRIPPDFPMDWLEKEKPQAAGAIAPKPSKKADKNLL